MKWYLKALNQYADFNGRARRKEYWLFLLFNLTFAFVAWFLDIILGIGISETGFGPIYGLYALAVLIPGLAVAVRRLHDTGRSGWMILVALIPIGGAIWLFVLMALDGHHGENEFGANPKELEPDNEVKARQIGDVVILTVVIYMMLNLVYRYLWPWLIEVVDSRTPLEAIGFVLGFGWSFIPISLAFAVKNKPIQVALFILGGIFVVEGLYESLQYLIQIIKPQDQTYFQF